LHEGGHEAHSTHRGRAPVLGSSDGCGVEVTPLLGWIGELLHDEAKQHHDKWKERTGLNERDALDRSRGGGGGTRHFGWIKLDVQYIILKYGK